MREKESWSSRTPPQTQEWQAPETWRKEAGYVAFLWRVEPDFLVGYKSFFPPGTINDFFEYYRTPPPNSQPPAENIHLVRRLIYLKTSTPEETLPPRCFLVPWEIAEQFARLWQNSLKTFFSGRLSEDFFPPRKFSGIKRQEFLRERGVLFGAYRQDNPRLNQLRKINPQIIYSLEMYYFQGKLLGQIGQELQLEPSEVSFWKELGLTALGIQEAKGKHLSRYHFWLGPVLRRWEENERYLASLPPDLQRIAWKLLEGQDAQTTSDEFGVDYKATQFLRQQLLGKIPLCESFRVRKRRFATEKLFGCPFDQQPITQITCAVLEAKAQGKKTKEIEKTLGVDSHQIHHLLAYALQDLQEAYPSFSPPSPQRRGDLRIKPEVWQQLSRLYKQFIAEMTREKRSLTPRQEEFLKGIQEEAKATSEKTQVLNLYLGRIWPRKKKRKEIEELARAALERKLPGFSTQEQEAIRTLVRGAPMKKIFPRGSRNPQFRHLLEKLDQISPRRNRL